MVATAPLTVDWSRCAPQFDSMAAANVAYRELHRHVTGLALTLDLPEAAQVLEVGAGTGNYILALAKARPAWACEAADNDAVMLTHLLAKAHARSLPVAARQTNLNQAWPWRDAFDLVVAVHAIRHLDEPAVALHRAFDALKPGGYLLIADIARPIDMDGWIAAIRQDVYQTTLMGTRSPSQAERAAERFLADNRDIIEAHRAFGAQYGHRRIPQMPLAEFCNALQGIGFSIVTASDGHDRNHTNVVVARRPEHPH